MEWAVVIEYIFNFYYANEFQISNAQNVAYR